MRSLPLRTRLLDRLRLVGMVPAVERMLVRMVTDRPARSWVARMLPNPRQYPRPTFRYAERRGVKYRLDLSNLMEWVIYFPLRDYGKEAVFSLARPGHVVIDVGAHIGEHALTFARLVGPSGRVFAFEPDPALVRRCLENITLNDSRNVELIEEGLSDTPADLELFAVNQNNLGMNRIATGGSRLGINTNVECQVSRGRVSVTTLDAFVSERRLDRVDLVKIDVEGFEVRVLRGAREALRRFRPMLLVEIDETNLREQGACAAELVDELLALGYTVRDAEHEEDLSTPEARLGLTGRPNFDALCTPLPGFAEVRASDTGPDAVGTT